MSNFFNNNNNRTEVDPNFSKSSNNQIGQNSVSFHQRRSDFMANIRRQGRFKLLSQKRSDPVSVISGTTQYDFRHLVEYPEKQKMIDFLVTVFKEVTEADIKDLISNLGQVKNMILNGNDVFQRHKGVIILRRILQGGDKNLIQKVIDLNLVPVLIQLMGDITQPHLVLESAWCVVNLALGDYNQVENMIASGLYRATHKVICNPHEKIFE